MAEEEGSNGNPKRSFNTHPSGPIPPIVRGGESSPPPGRPSGPPPPGAAAAAGGKGPPGGIAPKGGEKLIEKIFDRAFPILYTFSEDSYTMDQFKNLRVLWTRALLHTLGKIHDPIAMELLPKSTRFVVCSKFWADLLIPQSVVEKLDWIVKRTKFIDEQVEAFIHSLEEGDFSKKLPPQVVIIGAGYDTRSLRYGDKATFFEVDLPSVTEAKDVIYKRVFTQNDPRQSSSITVLPKLLGGDLQRTDEFSFLSLLEKEYNLDPELPTLFLFEAVLFYLQPPTLKANILSKCLNWDGGKRRFVIVDNLIPYVNPGPQSNANSVMDWLQSLVGNEESGKQLQMEDYDMIWGGAIQFVSFRRD